MVFSFSLPKRHLVQLFSPKESIFTKFMESGVDLGLCERGAKHGSGSLKQGIWGAVPPRNYRIFCFVKYRNTT